MIDPDFIRRYLTRWKAEYVRVATSTFNIVSIIVTIFGGLGISLAGYRIAWWIFGALILYLTMIAFATRPEWLNPARFVSRTISPNRLDSFPVYIPRVGLIGKEDVGKTTFFDASVSREYMRKRTSEPIAQIVVVPDSIGPKYLALIDTVGQRDHVQFDIQSMSDVLLVFVDHSASDSEMQIDETRLAMQENFLDQVAKAHQMSSKAKGVVIAINKCDLWDHDPLNIQRMKSFSMRVGDIFKTEKSYEIVKSLDRFSNHRPGQSAAILGMAAATFEEAGNV